MRIPLLSAARSRRHAWTLAAVLLWTGTAGAGEDHVLIVAGPPGSAVYARRFDDWTSRFKTMFHAMGVAEEHLIVARFADATGDGVATLDAHFAALAKTVRPDDRFWLVALGHGVVSESPPTWALPGAQPDAERVAAWLAAVPATQQIVVDCTSASGAFLSYMLKEGRVLVSALSPGEGSAPVFAEFLLRAVETRAADADADGRITLLEAFNHAVWSTAQWYGRQTRMGSFVVFGKRERFVPRGDWRVDGRASAEIFRRLYDGPAEMTEASGVRRLAPESLTDIDDPVVILRPPDGRLPMEWRQRRVLGEHALLIDTPVVTEKSDFHTAVAALPASPLLSWTPKPSAPDAPSAPPSTAEPASTDANRLPAPADEERIGFRPLTGDAARALVLWTAPPAG